MSEIDKFIDWNETRGRDDIRIPDPNIFDETIGYDCEKVFHWFDRFLDINIVEPAKVEVGNLSDQSITVFEEIPSSYGLFVRGKSSNEWLIFNRSSVGEKIEHEHNGTTHTIGPRQFITISTLDEGLRSPFPLFISSWRDEKIEGTSAWIREVGPSGSCMILTEHDGVMTEIRDNLLIDFDKHRGQNLSRFPEIINDIANAKEESDYLRQKFSDFIDYIS